jgi:hypothetical protein
LHVRNLMQRCYMLYIGTSTCSPNTCYKIEYKNKNCKIIKIFRKKSGPIYKMLKYREEWAFVSPRDVTQTVMGTAFCLRLQVEPAQLGPHITAPLDLRTQRSRVESRYDWLPASQSVSQYVLVPSHSGLVTTHYFPSESCFLVSVGRALSDERSDVICQSQSVCTSHVFTQ